MGDVSSSARTQTEENAGISVAAMRNRIDFIDDPSFFTMFVPQKLTVSLAKLRNNKGFDFYHGDSELVFPFSFPPAPNSLWLSFVLQLPGHRLFFFILSR